MKTLYIFLVATFALVTKVSAADPFLESVGTETGNGGGVVVCRNSANAIERVELLDFYEARALRNLKLDLGDPSEDLNIKMVNIFSKLSKVSPLRAEKYKRIFNNFFKEAVIIPDADLKYIDDSANVVVPIGCKKEQASILRTPEFPDDPRYLISKILWDKLDNNSKAGLILHEIIYQEGLSIGHKNSKPTRYMVGKITSTQMGGLTQEAFNNLLLSSYFKTIEVFGSLAEKTEYDDAINYKTDKSSFFAEVLSPQVRVGNLTFGDEFYVTVGKNNLLPQSALFVKEYLNPQFHIVGSDMNFEFATDGKVKRVSFRRRNSSSNSTSHQDEGNLAVPLMTVEYFDLKLTFSGDDDAGLVLDENERPLHWEGNLQTMNLKGYISPVLYSGAGSDSSQRTIALDGVLLSGYLKYSQKLPTLQGQLFFENGAARSKKTVFTPEGLVRSGFLSQDQFIQLIDGRRKKYVFPIQIEFRADGLAFFTSGQDADPDNIQDGCDISDFSKVSGIVLNEVISAINKLNLFKWDPRTLTISKGDDFVYEYNGKRKALPTFIMSFRTNDGTVYKIDSYVEDGYGRIHTGGLSLKEFAYLRTEKNALGQVIGRSCVHEFLSYGNYYNSLAIVNEAVGFRRSLGNIVFGSFIEPR